jgi:hypothetical protein
MVGCPSPRKEDYTQKAEQVSWLAAHLTLCAFPSFDRLRTVAVQISTPLTVAGQQWILPDCVLKDAIVGIHHFPLRSPGWGPLSLAYSIVLATPLVDDLTTAGLLIDGPGEVKGFYRRSTTFNGHSQKTARAPR